jgi:outer membrane immunogenic protein
MKSSTFVIAALGALVLASPAFAADLRTKMSVKALPPPSMPASTWTGFYVGGHLGYLWGHTEIAEADTLTVVALGPTNGWVGGVLAGANWQIGSLVLGGEADFGWSNATGNGAALLTPSETFKYEINWTSHARARIGYDFNGTLVYLAGGLAVAQAHVEEVEAITLFTGGGTYTGASIGGGVEHIFTPQISGRIEYLYDDFGHKTYTAGDDTYRVGVTGQTVRGALIVRFPSP